MSLRRADHSNRGILPKSDVSECNINLKNEEPENEEPEIHVGLLSQEKYWCNFNVAIIQ
jgi:hypothetical protein